LALDFSLNIAYLTVEAFVDIESIILFSFPSCNRRKWLKWHSLLKYPTSLRWIRGWRWHKPWRMIRFVDMVTKLVEVVNQHLAIYVFEMVN
jgi:hypothetical protein